jgi:hypothetical protein
MNIVDESGNILFTENQEFDIEIPIDENNKNKPELFNAQEIVREFMIRKPS